jgi:hypothetical protein
MFRKFLLTAMVAVSAALVVPATSQAAYSVTLAVVGGPSFVLADNTGGGPTTPFGDYNSTAGNILAAGSIGLANGDVLVWNYTGSSNQPGTPSLGFLASSTLNTYLTNSSGTVSQGYRLNVTVSDQGYTGPGSLGDRLDLRTELTGLNGFDPTTQLGTGVGQNNFVSTVTGPGQTPSSQSTSASGFVLGSDGVWVSGPVSFQRGTSYNLTETIGINLTAANTNGNGVSFQMNTVVTPAPAPAGLIMVATMLPFAGLLRRRLRKSEVATAA